MYRKGIVRLIDILKPDECILEFTGDNDGIRWCKCIRNEKNELLILIAGCRGNFSVWQIDVNHQTSKCLNVIKHILPNIGGTDHQQRLIFDSNVLFF